MCVRRTGQQNQAAIWRSSQLRFVGLAEFDMDGRAYTGGEMDRMMMSSGMRSFCSGRLLSEEHWTTLSS